MNQPVELCIHYEGSVPGVESGALSVNSFKSSLTNLLRALRETAAAVSKGSGKGKATRKRVKFDLQLTAVNEGSLKLTFLLVPLAAAGVKGPAQEALAARTVQTFVDGLKAEWNSPVPESGAVRKYLEALPEGVTRHNYEGRVGGQTVTRAELSTGQEAPVAPVEYRTVAPRLREVRATISAIKFDEKDGRVKLRPVGGGQVMSCRAEPLMLSLAAKLHQSSVIAQVLVRPDLNRLLNLRAAGEAARVPTEQQRRQHLVESWSETLKRLAE